MSVIFLSEFLVLLEPENTGPLAVDYIIRLQRITSIYFTKRKMVESVFLPLACFPISALLNPTGLKQRVCFYMCLSARALLNVLQYFAYIV